MQVTVATNAPQLERQMREIAERQLPFATAVGLTWTARDVVTDERAEIPRRVTVRSKRILQGVGFTPASKRDWPHPKAVVGHRDAFMVPQEIGGPKRAEKGARHVAIPLRVVSVRRTTTGAIPKRLKPRQLLDKKGVAKTEAAITGPITAGTSATGKKERVRFFFLRGRVHIKPRLHFRATAETSAAKHYGARFTQALDAAIRSARARDMKLTTDQGRTFFLKALTP